MSTDTNCSSQKNALSLNFLSRNSNQATHTSTRAAEVPTMTHSEQNEKIITNRAIQSRDSSSRPGTRQRPATSSRPLTAISTRPPTQFVVALNEGRGIASEVGLAALDLKTSSCFVSQFADSSTYVRVLHKINILEPVLVLITIF